jgi:hypothetical protein
MKCALQGTLKYAVSLTSTDFRAAGAFLASHLFVGLLLRPFPAAVSARVRSIVQRRVRLWSSAFGEDGITCIETLLRDIPDGCELARTCPGASVFRRVNGWG